MRSRVATRAFTARNTPASQVVAGKAAIAPTADIHVHAGTVPVEEYVRIAAMKDFPTAPGWRLVIIPLKPPTTTSGGIILTDEDIFANEVLCDIGYVAALGPAAYKDPRFGGIPWCKVGDFVNYGRLSGKDILFRDINGKDLHRIHVCNDRDVILGAPNPHAIKVFS